MIDERHPLYHLALAQLALPGLSFERVPEPCSTAAGAAAPAPAQDAGPATRQPMRDEPPL